MTEEIPKDLLSAEDYNFGFRPNSYFNQEDPIVELLTNIKGEARRKWLKQDLAKGLSPADFLLREKLGNDERNFLGRIHPTFMGGEYLPDRQDCEIEIARFVLNSTTQDVISIRARNCRSSISYFVVDEYQTEFACQLNSSDKPFTFGEFIYFLNNIYCEEFSLRGIIPICRASFDIDDCIDFADVEGWRNFISAESEFYPQFRDYFNEEENIWLDDCKQKIIDRDNTEANKCFQ